MVDKQEIILRYKRHGHSLRKISRDLGINRKTVKKYITSYEQSQSKLEEHSSSSSSSSAIKEELVKVPTYDNSTRVKRKLTNEIQVIIDHYLDQNQERKSSGLHKQVMKKIDILEALHEKGHQIGYTTVCNYIRERQQQKKEAYIRQLYKPGEDCEFDWGEVKLNIGGEIKKLQLAVFTSCYSNKRFAVLFYRQDMISFQQSHVQFYEYTGGVFHKMVYDNMRVAVRAFVGKNQKEATHGLLELSIYYGFSFRFCNVRSGNEKGHVERSVEYIRRKAFSRQIDFDTLEQANIHLQEVCDKLNSLTPQKSTQSINELFAEEKTKLYPLPVASFDCSIKDVLKVDKYSTVSFSTNRYSVPEQYVSKTIDVRIHANKLVFYAFNKKICEHPRSFSKHFWQINLSHYLDTLHRKPGALIGSLALEQACDLTKSVFNSYFHDTPKVFIELLHFAREHSFSITKIHQVIGQIADITPTDISLDKIKVLCLQNSLSQTIEQDYKDNPLVENCNRQLSLLDQLLLN